MLDIKILYQILCYHDNSMEGKSWVHLQIIVNSGYVNTNYTPKQITQIAESKNLFQNLSNELSKYLTQRSIGELFGNPNGVDLSFFSQGYDKILTEKLNKEEISGLGSLSLQLNRLFFSNNDNQVSSYLNLFNDIYGLNNPSEEELFNANSLLTQRNTLLSSTLLARISPSNYNN
jgi:hypothetical protein